MLNTTIPHSLPQSLTYLIPEIEKRDGIKIFDDLLPVIINAADIRQAKAVIVQYLIDKRPWNTASAIAEIKAGTIQSWQLAPPPRKRGRPKGSKNKPKVAP